MLGDRHEPIAGKPLGGLLVGRAPLAVPASAESQGGDAADSDRRDFASAREQGLSVCQ